MKPTGRQILILLFIPVWAIFASEMWMRILDPVPILPRYIQASDFGIRVNMPDESYVHQSAEYRVEIRTNSKGVRADQEFEIPKPEDVFRVVVLGDSFGMGYGSNIEDSSLRVMQERIAEAIDHRVEVVNLSVSGHGNAEELLMLRYEGLAYEPDVVVVMYTTTDPDDNVRSGLFRLTTEGTLEAARTTYLPAVRTRERLYSIPMYRWVAGNSHLYNQMREVAARHAKTVLGVLASRKASPPQTPTPSTSEPPAAPLGDRLTIALLKEIERVAREEAGAPTFILNVPVRRSRVEFVDKFIHDAPGSSDLRVITPLDAFHAQADPRRKLYWERAHGHWSPAGQRIAGDAMADAIIDWIQSSNRQDDE